MPATAPSPRFNQACWLFLFWSMGFYWVSAVVATLVCHPHQQQLLLVSDQSCKFENIFEHPESYNLDLVWPHNNYKLQPSLSCNDNDTKWALCFCNYLCWLSISLVELLLHLASFLNDWNIYLMQPTTLLEIFMIICLVSFALSKLIFLCLHIRIFSSVHSSIQVIQYCKWCNWKQD